MDWLLPVAVAIPLTGAALTAAVGQWLRRPLLDLLAIATSTATLVVTLIVLVHTQAHDTLHWLGGWSPRHGQAIGIAFYAGPLDAGMAVLVAILMTASLVFSWSYIRAGGRFYRTLMLAFLAAMCGFALSADVFNMFVWFELMGVAAYALSGYRVEQLGPLQGAINFAITNSVGSFMLLTGIALLYGRTGALNLAQMGKALSVRGPDGLTIVAFALIVSGFLVKSAIVPFHMWVADAHAVAPAPVCVLFAGVEIQLGLLGIARIYWTVFEAPFGVHASAVRGVLLGVGLATALLGAVMCFLQRHLKRLLAYSAISFAGIMLVGIALLDAKSLAGTAHMVLSHGLLEGGLFLACGVLLQQLESIDELTLHGRGRKLPWLGVLFALGGIGLIGAPYVGTFLGHSLIEDGAREHGHGWVDPLVAIAAGISSGAVLRAGARVFLGWGPAEDPLLTAQPPEEPPERKKSPIGMMAASTGALVLLGVVMSVVPGLEDRVVHGADRFRDRHAYVDFILKGHERAPGPAAPYVVHPATAASLGWSGLSVVVALAAALLGLCWRRIPQAALRILARTLGPPVRGLRSVHSGIPGDYVTWITVGAALVGGVWAVTLR